MNKENLKPIRTKSEAREKGKNGGKKSGEVRRERKALKEELLILLSQGDTQKKLSLALINKALTGDVRAFESIRDTIGEKPVDKQEIKTNQPAVLSEYSEKKIEEVLQRIKKTTYE